MVMSAPQPQEFTTPPNLSRPGPSGPTRTHVPEYLDRLPPCNHACPAGENIQAWLALCRQEDYEGAWRVIVRDNPMPAIHGRVCYHLCQSNCNRAEVDETVNIHAVERFLGDLAIERGWQIEPPSLESGKRVLVVGAGPSGLSAAYHLRRLGHTVELHEAGSTSGGMMRFGIPAYRLPRSILDAEIDRIEAMGVRFRFDMKVTDLEQVQRDGNFDAVFVAVGAHLSRRIGVPACDAAHVSDALDMLAEDHADEKPLLGRRVAVYGGGNTAMDAARTAKRLGASETIIVYRRTRERAPAHDIEIEEALEEGIEINWLSTIAGIDHDSLKIEKMALNSEGWPEPTGEYETLVADHLILALGQNVDTAFLRTVDDLRLNDDGTVAVDACMMSSHDGWFMGGDMVPSDRNVTAAVGHGKKAARHMDAWLCERAGVDHAKHDIATREFLNIWYYSEAKTRQENRQPPETRSEDFSEIVSGLGAEAALYEARRCLSCGNCFECDGCYDACPEDAVIKLGPGKRYRYDYDKCTGCTICYQQCPCGAITMTAEETA